MGDSFQKPSSSGAEFNGGRGERMAKRDYHYEAFLKRYGSLAPTGGLTKHSKARKPRKKRKPRRHRVKEWAKRMRDKPTPAESMLRWCCQELGFEILPQRIFGHDNIGKRIVDVFLPKPLIALEADGSQHYTPEGLKADAERAAFFAKHYPRIKFLRYPNHEILRAGFIDRLRGDLNAIVGAVAPLAVVASKPPLPLDCLRPASSSVPATNAPAVGL